MRPETETVDATLRSGNRVERSVNLMFISLVIVVLLALEIFAMSRVQTRSKTITESAPAEPAIRDFEKIDFGYTKGYDEADD